MPNIYEIIQLVALSAGALLLWSVRSAFWGGQVSTNALNRLKDAEDDIKNLRRYIEEYIIKTEMLIDRARTKQSETEAVVTRKIGQLELDFRGLRTEVTMHTATTDTEHRRFDREIESIWQQIRRYTYNNNHKESV